MVSNLDSRLLPTFAALAARDSIRLVYVCAICTRVRELIRLGAASAANAEAVGL